MKRQGLRLDRSGARLLLPVCLAFLAGCSGVDVTPATTETFAGTGYTRYAWRSEPPSQTSYSKDMLARKSPSIRAGVEAEMAELGYRRVDRSEADFLIEYIAAPGLNEGQLSYGGSNDMLYGSSVNRQIDGASADNAEALSGPVETAEMELVFLDADTVEVLWRVQISMVVEDANRIDHDAVIGAVRKAIAGLPAAP
jgi:hypothetical protein